MARNRPRYSYRLWLAMSALWFLSEFPQLAYAQERQIRLQCDGRGIDHISNLKNIPISGMYIEIHNSEVTVAGSVMGFDGDWKVTHENKATIGFSPVGNARYHGSVNRFSGAANFSLMSEDDSKVEKIVFADCRAAKPLF